MTTLPPEYKSWINEANDAIEYARRVRAYHRRRTRPDSLQRQTDIEVAINRLDRAMKPIRSEQGRFQWRKPTQAWRDRQRRLSEVSAQVTAERRKLWKMRRPSR